MEEGHLQGVLMMSSLTQGMVPQVELFEMVQRLQVDPPDLIQEDLLLRSRVDRQGQDEVGRQVQDEEDLQVLNVVVHQVL